MGGLRQWPRQAAAGGRWWPPRSRCRSSQPRPATRTPGPRSHHPYPPGGPRGSRPRCRRPPGPRVAARPTPIRRPARAEPVIEAARRGGTSSRAGSRRMKGRSSARLGTAMYRSLPSARARARTGAGGVRVGLDHLGHPPLRERGQPGSSEWSAGEIGDPSLGAREAGHPLALKEGPHALADRPLDPANLLQLTLGGRAQRNPPVRPPTRYSMSCWDKASRVASVTRITRMSGRRRSESVNRSRAW